MNGSGTPRGLKDNVLDADTPVALVDMDGTLCDCSGAIARGLARLRGPHEDPNEEGLLEPPAHISARRPQGLVIAPAQPWNADVEKLFLGRAVRYDGSNLDDLRRRLALVVRAPLDEG